MLRMQHEAFVNQVPRLSLLVGSNSMFAYLVIGNSTHQRTH